MGKLSHQFELTLFKFYGDSAGVLINWGLTPQHDVDDDDDGDDDGDDDDDDDDDDMLVSLVGETGAPGAFMRAAQESLPSWYICKPNYIQNQN